MLLMILQLPVLTNQSYFYKNKSRKFCKIERNIQFWNENENSCIIACTQKFRNSLVKRKKLPTQRKARKPIEKRLYEANIRATASEKSSESKEAAVLQTEALQTASEDTKMQCRESLSAHIQDRESSSTTRSNICGSASTCSGQNGGSAEDTELLAEQQTISARSSSTDRFASGDDEVSMDLKHIQH